ncbi:hypothetical protein [Spirillospora albida]|uniref:hypothetical protein n=1 Tax=Spirillospora albida TaxID=58123 RepID=UPI0004C0374B|nr:hypothetical protein [Spirillospora albida]
MDVRIAVRGYFLDASATQAATEYHPVTAAYLYDSRPGVGPADGPKTPVPSKTPITIQVNGKAGIPATGVDSVAINIAALGATTNAGLSLWADGESDPTSSTLLYTAGENNSLTDIVRVGTNGRIRLVNHGANPINVAIAIRGYFKKTTTTDTAGAGFEAVEPKTLLRTDSGVGTPGATTTPLAARASLTFTATSATSTPLQRISAVAGSLTAYAPAATGSLSITPTGGTEAKLGALQFMKGETSQLTDIVRPGTDGKLTITNHSDATVHVQYSIRGYFVLSPPEAVARAVEAATGTEDLATAVTSDAHNVAVSTGLVHVSGQAPYDEPVGDDPALEQPSAEELTTAEEEAAAAAGADSAADAPAGVSTVEVPRDPNSRISITADSGRLEFGVPAVGSAVPAAAGTVVYDGIQNGFSTAVQPLGDGGARILVHIDNANSPTTYLFPVALPEGARMDLNEADGSVRIVRDVTSSGESPDTSEVIAEELLGYIAKPWAKDANGRTWPTSYTLEGSALKLHVDLTPVTTEEGTVSPAFPVIADPKVSFGWSIYVRWSRNESRTIGNSTLSQVIGALASAGCAGKWVKSAWQKVLCLAAVNSVGWKIHESFKNARNRNACHEVKFDYGGGIDGWRWYTRNPTCR